MLKTIITTISLLSSTSLHAAEAQSTQKDERQQAKIVKRLYQATFGADAICKLTDSSTRENFRVNLNSFSSKNDKLMSLVKRSQYYAEAESNFKNKILVRYQNQADEIIKNDCNSMGKLLHELATNPKGIEATLEYETILSPQQSLKEIN